MTKSIILKEEICFDNLDKNTSKEDVFQGTILLENIKKELNKVPPELMEPFITDLYQHIPHADMEGSNTPETGDKIIPPKIPIFGWRGSTEILTQMMEEIQSETNIFVDRSMVDVFIRMATSEDLSQEYEKMYIACMTIEFSYFVEKFKHYCESFNPRTIERSGLFVSKGGNSYTADCLYNSKIKRQSFKNIIDVIFKKYC